MFALRPAVPISPQAGPTMSSAANVDLGRALTAANGSATLATSRHRTGSGYYAKRMYQQRCPSPLRPTKHDQA